jgi:hypothetical protein
MIATTTKSSINVKPLFFIIQDYQIPKQDTIFRTTRSDFEVILQRPT